MRGYFKLFATLCLLITFLSSPTYADVQLPDGYYFETTVDLKVKVLGGYINAERTWYKGKWSFNRAWDGLKFEYSSLDGSIASIFRGDSEYEKKSQAYVFGPTRSIVEVATGYKWQDRKGNAILYDNEGNVTQYTNRNNVKVTLKYDTDGKRTGVFAHNNKQILWYEYDTNNRVTAVKDYTNRRVEYRYTGDNLTEVIDVLGNSWKYEYTGGRITKAIDAENRPVTLTYNTGGRVAKISDTIGIRRTYQYDYDKSRRQFYVRMKTGGGKVTETWYDTEGFVTRRDLNGRTLSTVIKDGRDRIAKDSVGNATRNDYDEFGNIIKTTYADGATVSFVYEHTFSNITKKTDEAGIIISYKYDAKGNIAKLAEAEDLPEQRITEYSYDQYGNRTQIKQLGDAVTQEAITTFTYDAYGNLKTRSDAEGAKETYTFDVMGNPLTRKDALGHVWPRTYDAAGRLLTSANPLGHTTKIEFNKVGISVKVIDPLNRETTIQYDARNKVVNITNGLFDKRLFEYDLNGNLVLSTDEEGKSTQAFYNTDGYLTAREDGEGNVTQFEYDSPDNRVSRVVYPTFSREFRYDNRLRQTASIEVLDAQTRYQATTSYDRRDRPISRTDAKGRSTTMQYDALGRLTQTIDPAGNATHQGYDSRDNLISLTDPNANTHRFEYDRVGRQTKEIRPLGQTTIYQYNGAGQLTEKRDPKGQRIQYGYNNAGRRTTILHLSSLATTSPTRTINHTYDAVGNLTGYSDGTTSATYTLDNLNRRTGETVNFGPFSRSISYAYYKNGTKKSFTSPDRITYAYTYNRNNQVTNITIPGQGSITYSYHWTAPQSITLPGSTTRSFAHDPLLRVKNINVQDPARNSVLNYNYAYDPVHNIQSKETEHGAYAYSYDNLDRLTQANTPQGEEAFTYDAVGNRLTANGVAGPWNYNKNNQLLSYGNIAFAYDPNGNITRKTENGKVTTFTFNINNRLARIDDDAGNPLGQYYYDPFGRRLWKEVGGQRAYFMYADEGLIAEFDATGNTIRTYGYKPGSSWRTDPLFQKTGNNYTYYQNDHLGTPQKLTSGSGAVQWEGRYKSFGEAQITNETVLSNLRFPGQYFDQESGLFYNWNRYYDSSTGRYVSSDPIGLRSGVNLFLYARANPLSWTDRRGLDTAGCDGVPDRWETPCRLECCAKHDECFTNYNCGAGSFLCGGYGACFQCNGDVLKCFKNCGSSDYDDPDRPNYYCSRLKQYIDIPSALFPDYESAKLYCES